MRDCLALKNVHFMTRAILLLRLEDRGIRAAGGEIRWPLKSANVDIAPLAAPPPVRC